METSPCLFKHTFGIYRCNHRSSRTTLHNRNLWAKNTKIITYIVFTVITSIELHYWYLNIMVIVIMFHVYLAGACSWLINFSTSGRGMPLILVSPLLSSIFPSWTLPESPNSPKQRNLANNRVSTQLWTFIPGLSSR